jgi:uncharacterized membrane protein (UPF0127 family)
MRGYLVRAATEPGRRVLNWVVGTLLVVAMFAFLAVGANGPADPRLGAPSTTVTTVAPKPSRIAGFNEVKFVVSQAAPGSPFSTAPTPVGRAFCGALADTPPLQAQGLMNRNDLANYDGMIFTFPTDTNAGFFMKNTRFALTLAWFDNQGRFLGSVDMPPCPAKVKDCPTYAPPGGIRFRSALEVAQGGLSRLGIGAGTTVSLAGGC